MRKILITQRVDLINDYNEQRDALDKCWVELLMAAGFLPFLAANNIEYLNYLLASHEFDGLILTGGNDLVQYGGNCLQRDAAENYLLRFFIEKAKPILGICRGMQLIQTFFKVPLVKVTGHVEKNQKILVEGQEQIVNSYHDWGTKETRNDLEVWAYSRDGVIKAIRNKERNIVGVMWHIERFKPFREYDLNLIKRTFKKI